MVAILEALAVSAGAVAMGELGDKTQLLAVVLAARWRRPGPILLGILVATLANHALAAALGAWLQHNVGEAALRWGVGLSFLAVALWMLRPDQADDTTAGRPARSALGIFAVTTVAFFIAEMGDKTQIATVVLAARYGSLVAVTAGTTLGMMLANVPAVLLGERALRLVPLAWTQRLAAALFLVLGVLALAGAVGG